MLTVGSLFAGIGGFDLGLERTGGFTIRWQVEIDEYCRQVLAKHWPDVPRFGDIRTVLDVEPVDVLCGGFPCQDLSSAGRREGIDGENSVLWAEFARIIRLVRPRYIIVENVPALLKRGMGRVLADLAGYGYDAEWQCIPAAAFGAPHYRNRLFIIGYRRWTPVICADQLPKCECCDERFCPKCNLHYFECNCPGPHTEIENGWKVVGEPWGLVAYPSRDGMEGNGSIPVEGLSASPEPVVFGRGRPGNRTAKWSPEPGLARLVHGSSRWMERTRSLGNVIVPQVVEWIGYRILDYEERR
jgi:DNA (cytosine-5)-methyltransferase 1